MNNLPKISVITPVKNSVMTFEKTIQSLIAQNYQNLEYIVIDGASTDGTLEIIKKYQNHITYWESEDDKNNIIAHIKGIKKATGDVVAFLNADDFYEPGILQKIAEEFQKDPTLDIVSTRFRIIEKDGEGSFKTIEETTVDDMELSRKKIFKMPSPNARFFKRELFFRYGFQILEDDKNRVFFSNDVEYLIRFILKGIKAKTIDALGYTYLSHSDSITFALNFKTLKRLSEDKIFIAKKFLNSQEFELPKTYKKTFTKWIKKYRARIIIINLKEKNWSEAKSNFKVGIVDNGAFNFVFYFIKSLFKDWSKISSDH
jgi:glycosyltransferase involved in cell wall biosynthesis